jgi:Flp pilus assembly protein protease CpaA
MFWDMRDRRIPNRAIAILLLIAIFALLEQFDVCSLAAAGATLLLLVPWKKGVLGAGDVKLLFVSALYLGLPDFCISLALMGMAAFIYIFIARKRAADSVAMGAFYAPAAAAILIVREMM